MRRLLIIANLFHASPRIPGLAKYFPEFGWQPIILTPPLGENPESRFGPPNDFGKHSRVVETHGYVSSHGAKHLTSGKYKTIRSFLKFFYRRYQEIAQYPDAEKTWKPIAVDAGLKFLNSENVDVLMSSSSPATSHLIARELKNRLGIPWVAELRDLWTQNPNYAYSPLRKMFERRLELKTLSEADALVALAKLASEKLGNLHRRKAYTVTNGFDPADISDGKSQLTSKFTITYTGQIYAGKQDPSKLLTALKNLILNSGIDRNRVEVRFYGPENAELRDEAKRLGLSDVVIQYGVVPRHTAYEKQRESQLLLLLDWEDPREKGVYTGKIFEYLAALRPILATGGQSGDVVDELIKETHSGKHCPSMADIEDALKEAYQEYESKGRAAYDGNMKEIDKYSYRELAREYSEIFDGLARTNAHNPVTSDKGK